MKKPRPVFPDHKFASEDEDYIYTTDDLPVLLEEMLRANPRLVAEILLATPRSRLIDEWMTGDGARMVVENSNPDNLSDDALRLLCVLVLDLAEGSVVPSAFCDLIGERRTKNAMAELEAGDPEACAFSKHGILAMKVYADALTKKTRKIAKRYGLSEDDVWSLREYDALLKKSPAGAKLMERYDPALPAKYAEAKLKVEKFKAQREKLRVRAGRK